MNMNMQKSRQSGDALLEKIRQVDFALYETVLYLDAYPECHEAMTLYHSLTEAREELLACYEASAPLTAFTNKSNTSWDWVKTPMPWEN